MSTYRYLFADLRTNSILAELPLQNVNFEMTLNGDGAFNAELGIQDPVVQKLGWKTATRPTRTAYYIDRDGTLVGGGVIWTRKWQPSSGVVALQGREFESYFSKIFVGSGSYTNTDVVALTRTLINTAQATMGGNIGVTVGTETSTLTASPTYQLFEYKDVLSAVQDLSKVYPGFDYSIDVAYDSSGIPQKYLHLGFPRRGRTVQNTGLLFEFPGNIVDYEWPEDGLASANDVRAIGAGSGDGYNIGVATITSSIDQGYPLLQETVSYADVTDPTIIANAATSEAKAKAIPVTIPILTVRAGMDPVLGSYITGDDCRLRITDDFFPDGPNSFPTTTSPVGLDTYKRIVKVSVVPGDNEDEKVRITLNEVPF